MNNPVILFGCGEVGSEASAFIGSENIDYFCDNDKSIVGTEKYGKKIISFSDLVNNHKSATVLITANEKNSYEIVRQCVENGIQDHLVYLPLKQRFSDRELFLSYIESSVNRNDLRDKYYIDKIDELISEIDYFKEHADIHFMKPAKGKLREWQLKSVQTSAEFFEIIDDLQIRPFLCGGNLLGHIRHGGFIPWDDDLDFAIMRNEYERLKTYCQMHIYTEAEFGSKEKTMIQDKEITNGLEDYCWHDEFDFIQIAKIFPDGSYMPLDFFVLDYYSDSYSFDKFMDLVGRLRKKWMDSTLNLDQKVKYLREAQSEIAPYIEEESDNIYFGLDNMDIMQSYHKGGWIPRKVVFPLRKILYEGKEFWIPNDSEEFLHYEYEDIWNFPEDNIGLPKHFKWHGICEKDKRG